MGLLPVAALLTPVTCGVAATQVPDWQVPAGPPVADAPARWSAAHPVAPASGGGRRPPPPAGQPAGAAVLLPPVTCGVVATQVPDWQVPASPLVVHAPP